MREHPTSAPYVQFGYHKTDVRFDVRRTAKRPSLDELDGDDLLDYGPSIAPDTWHPPEDER